MTTTSNIFLNPRRALLCGLVLLAACSARAAGYEWSPPASRAVQVHPDGAEGWKVTSTEAREFTLESEQRLAAQPGDAFEINLRLRTDLNTRAMPELVGYDAQGRELPARSALAQASWVGTTDWQSLHRVLPVPPGATSVRARLRARGAGEALLGKLEFQPAHVDPYTTGALISQPHPTSAGGVVLESNHGIVNRDLVTTEDRDGDGKWALVSGDLDRLTAPSRKGEDWRTGFEDNPNEILWSDGAVLKSDSVRANRAPDAEKALHFRMRVHPGPYIVSVSDPGRSVAVSLDGQQWKRHEGGQEIALGKLPMTNGVIELWLDACYRDPVSVGPVYFDYVRLMPAPDAAVIERLFAAAQHKATKLARGTRTDTRVVAVAVNGPGFSGGTNWPVRCGLPLPEGDLASANEVAVLDDESQPIPCQTRAMASWPDGSVKWLHLDWAHDFSASGEGRYSIAYGHRVEPAPARQQVRVHTVADGLEVDTGALRFLVSKAHFGLIEQVRLPNGQLVQGEPVAVEVVEANGKTWHALELPTENLAVEQAGPLHAVILAETQLAPSGKPASGFYHRARIHAYAGSPLVQVDYFVANTDSRPARDVGGSMASKVPVKAIALKIKPTRAVTSALLPSGAAAVPGLTAQKAEEDALVSTTNGLREVRAHLRGWAALGLEGGGWLAAGVEGFREQFPKALRWDRAGLEIALWAEEGGEYDWIEGVGKTHHMALYYGATGNPADSDLLAEGPVLALARPEWYVSSGAFGPQIPAAASPLPAVERTLAKHIRQKVVEHVGLGFENYGDHSSGGYVKSSFLWDNNEYDLPAGCITHFARTGDREVLRLGLAGALHYLDVDTIHYSSRKADWAGVPHVHSHATFGHHTAEAPNFSHAGCAEGLLWYSYLTGEPIGVRGAQNIADWVLRNLHFEAGMERAVGHPLMTLNDVYEATWDERYLRGSAWLVDQALKWEHPERSGFLAHITESPAYYSGSPFCGGLLPTALIKFNQWANLPEIEAALQRVAQWTLTDVWRPPGGLQSKGGSPRTHGDPRHIASYGPLLAHVYTRTRDPLYLVVPRALAASGFGETAADFGTRATGLVFNYLPRLLALLDAAGQPEPEPRFELIMPNNPIPVLKGHPVQLVCTLRNTGANAVEHLHASFHSRLDLKVTALTPPPAQLAPGQTLELKYEVQAPEQLDLTCEYNRTAYAHWSAVYERAGKPCLAHGWATLDLKEK